MQTQKQINMTGCMLDTCEKVDRDKGVVVKALQLPNVVR